MNKPLYELDLRKFREKYNSGDFYMLECIKDYISSDLMDLYYDVLNYNEIYANSWTIEDLFKMGEEDKYWTNRANFFIEKYNIPKEDYNEFGKYFDKYMELRNNLLDDLGLSMYIGEELLLEDVLPGGIVEYENITNPSEMNDVDSYTVARVRNFGHCVELHYSGGEATVEYGYKVNHNCWEDGIEEVDWFNKDMTEEEIIDKLQESLDYHMERNMKYNDKVYAVCYNSLDVFNSKKEAKDFYSTCYYMSEGAEHERYASILVELNFCDTGRDNISEGCHDIRIKLNEDKEEFLVVELGETLSVEEAIKYYESKIKTILKISDDFDVNFDSTIPFEDFDDKNLNMYSFSEYYKKIFKKMNIHFNNITTKEVSDGKYELNLDGNILDVRAWDKLCDVVSNVESALEFSANNYYRYVVDNEEDYTVGN